MLDFSLKELTSSRFELKVLDNGNCIGEARLIHEPDLCILTWIEVEESFQRKGVGTEMMNYIASLCIEENKTLRINVVDEETLGFYSKWLTQKMAIPSHKINNFIQYSDESTYPIMVIPRSALMHEKDKRYKF